MREDVLKSLEKLNNTDIGGFWVDFRPRVRAGSHYADISIINKNGIVFR